MADNLTDNTEILLKILQKLNQPTAIDFPLHERHERVG